MFEYVQDHPYILLGYVAVFCALIVLPTLLLLRRVVGPTRRLWQLWRYGEPKRFAVVPPSASRVDDKDAGGPLR